MAFLSRSPKAAFATATLLVVTLAISAGGMLASPVARASSPATVLVTFSERLPVVQAAQIVQRVGGTILELRFEYSTPAESRGGGFFVDGSWTPTRMADMFQRAVQAMIADEIADNARLRAKFPSDPILAAQGSGLAYVLNAFPSSPIDEALILADANMIVTLAGDPRVSRIVVENPRRPVSRGASGRGPGLAARASTHVPYSAWVPDTVYVTITDSSFAGQRYVQQTFIWNSGRTLGFPTDSGFEAQFYLNNSDGLTYLTNQLDLNGFPSGAIFDSNMPGKYLVTDFGDPSNQRGYMVGTYDAPLLTTAFWYNTYVRTPNGNTNFDGGEIQPQETQEAIGGCQSTWCMGGHETCYTGFYPIQVPTLNYSWTWTGSNC